MRGLWNRNRTFLIALGFMFCAFSTFFITKQFQVAVSANGTNASAYSFYPMSQAAAQFFNNSMNPLHGGALPHSANMQKGSFYIFGNAGGLLGYMDEWEKDVSSTLVGSNSANTVEYYYHTLKNNVLVKNADGVEHPSISKTDVFAGYCYYGYALSQLGLDETSMQGSSGSIRQILGIIMLALYSMATSVEQFFHLVFGVLRFANPYRLFLGATSVIRTEILGSAGQGLQSLTIGNGVTGAFNAAGEATGIGAELQTPIESGGALLSFINLISSFYNDLYYFSKAFILPILLAFALFAWLVINKGGGFGKVFKPFFMKVAFIVLGVPLMFAAYSAAIDLVYDFTMPNNSVSAAVVMTTFFDFEKWVTNSQLSWKDMPTLNMYVEKDGTASLDVETMSNARTYLSKLNEMNFNEFGITYTAPTLASSGNAAQNLRDYDTTMLNPNSGMSLGNVIQSSSNVGPDGSVTSSNNEAFLSAVVGMLQRYAAGDIVSSAAYQTYVTGSYLSKYSSNHDMQAESVVEYVVCQTWQNYHPDLADMYSYKKGTGAVPSGLDDIDGWGHDEVVALAKARFNGGTGSTLISRTLWASGGMVCSFHADGKIEFSHMSDATGTGISAILGNLWGGSRPNGLSCMAMYNYLNSSFDSAKMTVYSAGNTSSDQVKVGHYAVTTVGTGLMKWIYLIDAICLLGCSTILGYGYAGGLLIASFKSIFKMIPNVLTGMLGSLRGIASALALTAALIVELFGTCILYSVANQMLYLVYSVVENPLLNLLTGQFGGSGASVTLGMMLPVVFGVLSIMVLVVITGKLLEWRVVICQSATEACTSFINSLVGANVAAPNLHDSNMSPMNMLSMAAGVGMTAAGMSGMTKEDMRNAAGNGLDALTGKNGERGLLTAGSGGILSSTSEKNDGLTKEQREALGLGVKKGNGTGETPGKDGENGNNEWSMDQNENKVGESGKEGSTEENGKTKAGEGSGEAGGKNGKAGSNGFSNEEPGMEGGTVDAEIDAELDGDAEEGSSSVGAGELGYNADQAAQDYINENLPAFEAEVAERAAQNKAATQAAYMEGPEYQQMLDQQQEAASRSSITDTNGIQTGNLQVVNAETGEAYTQADKDAGASYSVVNAATGEAYTDSNGQVYANMDASQITMDDNGKVSSVTDDNGNVSMVSQGDNQQKAITDSNGVTTGNLQVVNAETGESYSQRDKDSGAAYTVVDSNGQVYVDSNGQAYQNMDAHNVHVDATTGQVDAIRDGNGHELAVMNNDTQASSIITAPDGTSQSGIQIVNSAGAPYTEADRTAGDTFSVVTKDGTPYVDSNGQAYVNMPAADVSIDPKTGEVNGVRDGNGTVSVIQSVQNAQSLTAQNGGNNVSVEGGQTNVQASANMQNQNMAQTQNQTNFAQTNTQTSNNQMAMEGDVNTGSAASAATTAGIVYATAGSAAVVAGMNTAMSQVQTITQQGGPLTVMTGSGSAPVVAAGEPASMPSVQIVENTGAQTVQVATVPSGGNGGSTVNVSEGSTFVNTMQSSGGSTTHVNSTQHNTGAGSNVNITENTANSFNTSTNEQHSSSQNNYSNGGASGGSHTTNHTTVNQSGGSGGAGGVVREVAMGVTGGSGTSGGGGVHTTNNNQTVNQSAGPVNYMSEITETQVNAGTTNMQAGGSTGSGGEFRNHDAGAGTMRTRHTSETVKETVKESSREQHFERFDRTDMDHQVNNTVMERHTEEYAGFQGGSGGQEYSESGSDKNYGGSFSTTSDRNSGGNRTDGFGSFGRSSGTGFAPGQSGGRAVGSMTARRGSLPNMGRGYRGRGGNNGSGPART